MPTGTAAPGRPLLAVPLEGPHEVEPAVEVLRAMYEGGLRPGLSPLQLLMVRKQAQHLLCSFCVDLCTAALQQLAPEGELDDGKDDTDGTQLNYKQALEVLSSPDVACMLEDPQLSTAVGACAQAVAAYWDHATEVVCSKKLGRDWQSLSPPALRHVLGQDTPLQLDSEDTVLLLLHCWVVANCPLGAARKQLRALLRPLQLSPCYLHHVLPKLEWLGLTKEEHADLVFAAHMCLATGGVYDPTVRKTVRAQQREWAERRKFRVITDDSVVYLHASWSRQHLAAFLQECQAAVSRQAAGSRHSQFYRVLPTTDAPTYYAGLTYKTSVIVGRLGPCAQARAPFAAVAIHCALPKEFAELGATTRPALLVRGAWTADAEGAWRPLQPLLQASMHKCATTGRQEGPALRLLPRGALDMATWQPLLAADGRLIVKVAMVA